MSAAGKAMNPDARRLIVYVALHQRKHGRAPTWREASRALGFSTYKTSALLRQAKRRRYVRFDARPGSLQVTPHGLRAAATGYHVTGSPKKSQIGKNSTAPTSATAPAQAKRALLRCCPYRQRDQGGSDGSQGNSGGEAEEPA